MSGFERALKSIKDSSTIGVDFIFLVDGSNSMASAWSVLIFVLRALGRFLLLGEEKNVRNEMKYRVAVVQFGNETEIVCSFTSSALTLTSHCQDLRMITGSTATHRGLGVCKDLFNGSERGAACCCILFTDGSPDNQRDAEKAADALANDPRLRVSMIGIGIGPHINKSQLAKVAPLQDYYVQSIEELKKLITDMNAKPSGPPTIHHGDICPRMIKLDFELAEDVASYEIKKYNHQNSSFVTIGTTLGRVPEFVVKDLAPDTEHTIQVIAHLTKAGVSPPGILKFKTPVERPEVPLMSDMRRLQAENDRLRQEILSYRPPAGFDCQCVNILMAGRVGAGKSSGINTFCSALYGNYQPRAIAGSSATSFTLGLTKYALEGSDGKTYIYLWDVYGWNLNNYQSEFESLLGGTLKEGYKEGMKSNLSVASEGDKIYLNPNPTYSDRVHSTMLFTDPFSLNLEAEINRLCFFRDRFAHVGDLQGQVLFTKLDLKDPYLETHPETIYANPTAMTLTGDLRQALGPQMGIHPLISYLSDYGNERNAAIEYLALSALARALRQADMLIRQKAPRRPSIERGTPAVGATIHCPCGEFLESGWQVCPVCDRPYCQQCGFELKPNYKRCPKCRTPRSAPEPPKPTECPVCKEPFGPEYTVCPVCDD